MRTILVATLVLVCSVAQALTTWITPFVFIGVGDALICEVTDLDKKPTFANVQLIDASGLGIAPKESTCGQSLNPGVTCFNAGDVNVSAQCNVITGTSKVRVALEVVDVTSGSPRVVVPATKQ
jgi:hypothetical protein